MKLVSKAALLLLALLCAVSVNAAQSDIDSLLAQNPGLIYYESPEEEYPHVRIYGMPFDTGTSVIDAAQNFVNKHAGVFDVDTSDLALGGPGYEGADTVSLMYDESTSSYKFKLVYFTHTADANASVMSSRIGVLVENSAPYNVVLVAATVRALGSWSPSSVYTGRDADSLAETFTDPELVGSIEVSTASTKVLADDAISDTTVVVVEFVGTDDSTGVSYHYIIDADSKAILDKREVGMDLGVSGNVSGYATQGAAAAACNSEALTNLEGALVKIVGGDSTYTDVSGNYSISGLSSSQITIESFLRGERFSVIDKKSGQSNALESGVVTPTGTLSFVHDGRSSQYDQAEVNAFVSAMTAYNYVVDALPSFSGIDAYTIDLWVNFANPCIGAKYIVQGSVVVQNVNPVIYASVGGQSEGSCNNLAFSSTFYHEYGHHLEWLSGRAHFESQTGTLGSYAEGYGDALSAIIAQNPGLELGRKYDSCSVAFRTADNSLQYPQGCTAGAGGHTCGQLLSGCVWDLHEELEVTEPTDYNAVLADLMIGQLFIQACNEFHSITPTICIDYLVLDDNDGNIWNGTPHSQEITTAFGNHNMLADVVPLLVPEYYSTIQEAIDSAGTGDTVTVGNDGIPTYYAEVLNFDGKAITVIGEFSSIYNPVRIKGAHFESGEDSTSVLENFKISGWDYGVLCYNSAPTLKRLFITGIKPTVQSKAAIHLAGTGWNSDGDSPARIINCTITDSWRGIYYHVDSGAGSAFVRNCVIEDVTTGIANVGDTSVTAFVLDYNDVYDATVTYFQVTDSGSNSIDDDPNIVNSLPYYPSAAIDAGDTAAIYNDPDDSRNDMGWRPCMICEDLGGFPREVAEDGSVLPTEFALDQNHPNPFNPVTQISLSLPKASDWRIEIFNMLGQRVDEFSGRSDPGVVTVSWNGSRFASGVYLYKATAGEFSQTKKMVMVK